MYIPLRATLQSSKYFSTKGNHYDNKSHDSSAFMIFTVALHFSCVSEKRSYFLCSCNVSISTGQMQGNNKRFWRSGKSGPTRVRPFAVPRYPSGTHPVPIGYLKRKPVILLVGIQKNSMTRFYKATKSIVKDKFRV